MNIKIEQGSNFVAYDSQLFFDAQEAKKVSERRVGATIAWGIGISENDFMRCCLVFCTLTIPTASMCIIIPYLHAKPQVSGTT